MHFFNFLFPYIELLSSGKVLRRFFAILYKVTGWLQFIFCIIAMLMAIYAAFETKDMVTVIGGLLTSPLLAVQGYVLLQLGLYRAKSLADLTDSDYTAIPIMAIFFRYLGEFFFVVMVMQGFMLFLMSLFSGAMSSPISWLLELVDMAMGGQAFFYSLIFLLFLLIWAIVQLLFFYYLAESIVVLAEVASNTRKMALGGIAPSATYGSTAQPTPATQTVSPPAPDPPKPKPGQCGKCNHQNGPDDAFCMNCGNKLK